MPHDHGPFAVATLPRVLRVVAMALALSVVQAPALVSQVKGGVPFPTTGDEFVGPFPSWTNARTTYGAVGDGVADDTAALQKGLSALHADGASPVLYLPPGTYRITATLVLAYGSNVSVVGADPETVRLVWDGPSRGRMLFVNGVAYSKVSRITFDGRGRASEAIAQSSDNTGGHFDTGNEYADDRFIDVEYGIHGGFLAGGFAETSIVRAKFIRNTKAGIAIGNFNALDLWVWDSLFDHCEVGVTNDPGAGNYRVYNSVFRASRQADLSMQNTGLFSARGNYSIGSTAFFISGRPINHPANVDIQRNLILDPVEPTAIQLGNQGPGILLDNVIRSRPGTTGPVVLWRSPTGSDIATIGNTFTVDRAVSANGRVLMLDDRVVPAASLTLEEPHLPPAQPSLAREVFEVPAGSDSRAIQSIIAAAARRTGNRPVVHFPFGAFDITEPILVPAGDLQLVGDGARTVLRWRGSGPGPVIRLATPTRVTLRELTVTGIPTVDGIVIEGLNTRGSRVRLDGVQLRSGEESNLSIEQLDEADVEITDFGHAYSPRGASVKIAGGRAARRDATGRTTIYSGASSGNGLSYDIRGHAAVLIQDMWYEAGTPGFANVQDGASVTMQGLRVATGIDPAIPALTISNATVALLNLQIDDRIQISGPGRADVLSLGLLREFQRVDLFSDTSAPKAHAVFINTRQRTASQGMLSPGTLPLPDIGAPDPAFIRARLAQTRSSTPPRLTALPATRNDLRMFRVWVTDARNNIRLAAASPSRTERQRPR